MRRLLPRIMKPRRILWLLFIFVWPVARVDAAEPSPLASENAWREIESELLAEINLLRDNPRAYAEQILAPMKTRVKRVPEKKSEAFQALKVFVRDDPLDDIWIAEGGSEQSALAAIDEAIAELRETPRLPKLARNAVLDEAARFFSRDFAEAPQQPPPHIDTLGRAPAVRISAFGAIPVAWQRWTQFTSELGADRKATLRVFQKGDDFHLVELFGNGGYRYWYVPPEFGKFIRERGRTVDLPPLQTTGFECEVTIDVSQRLVRHGTSTVPYPFRLPMYGEAIVWGTWSRPGAARGMVCWWVIDPGVADRGHRHTLLTPEFRFAGVGCFWSQRKGLVGTFDATAEELVPPPK